MNCPQDPNGMPPLPPPRDPPTEVQALSQVSGPSSTGKTSFSSPLKASDLGMLMTPEHRKILDLDDAALEEGYDSEGSRPPCLGSSIPIIDERQADEEPLPFGPPPVSLEGPPVESFAQKTMPVLDVPNMKIPALKEELKRRGLSLKGNKAELGARLKEAIEKGVPLVANLTEEKASNLAGDSFSPGAYWEFLECTGELIKETREEGFRAPTEPEGEKSKVTKRNYTQKFDRMVFTGKAELPRVYRNGRLSNKYQTVPHTETQPRMAFIRKHNLCVGSHPAKWFEAFFPTKAKDKKNFTVENCLRWTNTKAMMEGAGLGGKYNDFVNFDIKEFKKHLGLYLLQALSPSPQIEMKFQAQATDPVNGNDLVHEAFGGCAWKAERRHKHFKCFFSSVDPTLTVPSRNTHPNHKIGPLLKHMISISKEAVCLGRDLSCDEQTIGFQGNHKDKQRMTYKKEGDGFLADCICSDGYTYSFFFRHQPSSQKIMAEYKCSPLHARVIGLIHQLPDKYYTLGMDNLYMSAKLCRLAYGMQQKVMVHGVTRPSLRGIPPAIKQNEVSKKKDLEEVRHTVKAAVLKGDEVCKDLLSVSLYDTKPVYFLTNATETLEWTQKKRKVYNPQTQRTFQMPFHRLNIIDFYNHNMGNVDLADQLRNHYRYDSSWHRNRKWWWAIWWWGFQVMLTNSYILYVKYHKLHKAEKDMVSHYDFIKLTAIAWIDPGKYGPQTPMKELPKSKRSHEEDQNRPRTRRKIIENASSVGSATSKRCREVNDDSLDPVKGKLNMRLNPTVQHWPEEAKVGSRCQLHRWARGRELASVMKGVIKCSICQVTLCLKCYHTFHKDGDILGKKNEISKI